MKIIVLIIIPIISVFFSCSSLPGKVDPRSLAVKNKAASYLKDGITQYNSGRYTQAIDLFQLAYQLNASVDNEVGIVVALNSIGKTKLAQGKTDEAFTLFNQALTTSERLEDEQLLLRTKGNLGDYYTKTGELDNAISVLKSELDKIEKIENEESAYIAHSYSLILRKKGEYDKALTNLNRSLDYNLKEDAFRPLASDYYMMASILSLKGNYSEALLYALNALKYDKMIEYPQGIAEDLDALSIISGKLDNIIDSDIYKKRAIAVREAIGNTVEREKLESELENNQTQ